jgi:hypothetical protein
MAFGLSATAIAGLGSAALGAYSATRGSKQSGTATSTQQNQLDPRVGNIVFGQNGNDGLLSQYQGMLNTPQSQPLQNYGQAAGDYLTNYGSQDMGAIHGAATGLMAGQQAPTSAAAGMTSASAALPAYASGNQVQAPAQNNIDLTGSYQNLLSGGDTTALNKSMNAAVGATNAGFNTNVANLTNTLQRSVLPGISQNAVLAGQYGGSRQGVAQGLAISDYTNQLNNANSQLAATNSANTTAQAANAYQQGQDRALAATQGLGAQQYGVASQDANTKNAAEFMNVGNMFDASKTNAGLAQQAGLANAGFNQQTNLANQGAQLTTNAQNNGAALGGAGLLGGLSGSAYGTAQNDQNYGINRATQVNGLLAPYLGLNQSSTTSQPIYQNTAGNVLGGAMLGSQLGGSLFGGSKSGSGSTYGGLLDLFGNNSSFGSGFGS